MEKDVDKDELITRFLLDELPEAERENVIERSLSDDRFFEQILDVEEELVDDYVRGDLTAQVRTRFEQYYLNTPERRERVKHANAFNRAVKRERSANWWRSLLGLRLERPALAYSLAAAAALLLLGGAWMAVDMVRLRQQLRQSAQAQQLAKELKEKADFERARNAQLAEEMRQLQGQFERERTDWQKREQELQRLPGQRPPDIQVAQPRFRLASFELPAGAGGQRGPAQTLTVESGAELIRLQLNLSGDDYPTYRAVLQTLSGDEVLAQSALKSQSTKDGRAVIVSFSARQVPGGDYVLRLSGMQSSGAATEVELLADQDNSPVKPTRLSEISKTHIGEVMFRESLHS